MQEKPIAALIEKIAKEFEEANAGKWTITKIVKALAEEDLKDAKAVRKKAVEMLENLDPKAASVYMSFQRMQVRTSLQVIEGFDRGNIIKSLLRETEVARGVAEKIGREVEEKLKDLEVEDISTALIRELVNVKLLEYGHENVRKQYTRIGLPVFEAMKKIEQMPYSNRAILTEYNLLRVIPGKLGKMHLEGEIFIACLEDFSTRPVATSIVPEIGESPKETVLALLEKANRLQNLVSWRPNIFGANAAVASNVGKKTARDAGLLFSRAAKTVFLSGKSIQAFNTIHLFEPEAFARKGVERESMVAAGNAMLKEDSGEKEVFEKAVAVDTKYKLKLLKKEVPRHVLNCRNREWILANGIAFEGKGLCSFIGLNLTAIALGCNRNESAFFEALGKKARAVEQLDSLKRTELSERRYLKDSELDVGEMHSALALDSLFEASKIAIGTEKKGEALAFSEKVLAELRKGLPENFVLAELKNGKALQRFEAENKKNFNAERAKPGENSLRKSSQACKHYSFTARAGSRKELNELIDSNVRLIEFGEKA